MAGNIIRKAHEENGHFSKSKLEHIIRREYYIQNLSQKIQTCIRNCIICILADRKTGKREGVLNPIPKEELPLETYHLDHLGPKQTTTSDNNMKLWIPFSPEPDERSGRPNVVTLVEGKREQPAQ